jgi:hypothetical protein
MASIFSSDRLTATVANIVLQLLPTGTQGAVRIVPDGPTIRPLAFGERGRLLADSVQALDPVGLAIDLISAAATGVAAGDVSSPCKAVALAMAGAELEAPALSITTAAAARSRGWSLESINAQPAEQVDRIALEAQEQAQSGWNRIVFTQQAPLTDTDTVVRALAARLVNRVDSDYLSMINAAPSPQGHSREIAAQTQDHFQQQTGSVSAHHSAGGSERHQAPGSAPVTRAVNHSPVEAHADGNVVDRAVKNTAPEPTAGAKPAADVVSSARQSVCVTPGGSASKAAAQAASDRQTHLSMPAGDLYTQKTQQPLTQQQASRHPTPEQFQNRPGAPIDAGRSSPPEPDRQSRRHDVSAAANSSKQSVLTTSTQSFASSSWPDSAAKPLARKVSSGVVDTVVWSDDLSAVRPRTREPAIPDILTIADRIGLLLDEEADLRGIE